MAKDEKQKVGLLRYLTFEKESRTDGTVSAPIESGRIRYFLSTFTKRNSDMLLPALLFILTALPLFGSYIFMQIMGPEQIYYNLQKITDLPYFMTNIGIGISSSSDVLSAQIAMLNVYRLFFLAVAAGMFFMSIGLSGMMRLSAKYIWKDSFVTKKDTYGNNVPRTLVEFGLGVKKYWWQMLIFGAVAMVLVAGVSSTAVYFVENLWSGTAGAGHYILLIAVCFAGLIGAMFLLYFAPFIVMYDIPVLDKIKNSLILAIQMFLPNIFILAVIALPLILISVSSGFINILIAAVLIVFGVNFYSLLTCNYLQYYAEKIINPVYTARLSHGKKKKKK